MFAANGSLSGFPKHVESQINDALHEWAQFLLGHRPDTGPHEQHMFVVDVVEGTSITNAPPNISRYLARAIDLDVARNQDSAMSYAKMGKFVLFGFVAMKYPRRWKGTRLNVQQGRFGERDIELPSSVIDFIFERARLAAEKYSHVSERQQTKIRQSYERNLDRAARSETFRAVHHDVLMFGSGAFEATQPTIRDNTKKNKE